MLKMSLKQVQVVAQICLDTKAFGDAPLPIHSLGRIRSSCHSQDAGTPQLLTSVQLS